MPEATLPEATLPEGVPVFHIDLGQLDVLLAASDFYAAAAQSECRFAERREGGRLRLEAKGRSHDCVFLEPHFQRLFSPTLPADSPEATAFLMKRKEGAARAFVVARGFELRSLPLREFRLLPRGIRAASAARGLVALRFEGGRLQILLRAGDIEPAQEDGGARSESS